MNIFIHRFLCQMPQDHGFSGPPNFGQPNRDKLIRETMASSAITYPGPQSTTTSVKFYLKGFTDPQKTLWVYEKGKPSRASKPKDEAHRENYYTYEDKGYQDTTIERSLSKSESIVAPIFRKLANPQFQMTEEQAANLIVFGAMNLCYTCLSVAHR